MGDSPRKRVGAKRPKKPNLLAVLSVINKLRIYKNLQNNFVIMKIIFYMADTLFWGSKKWVTP